MIAHLKVADHWCSSPHCESKTGIKRGRCTFAQKLIVTYEGITTGGGVFETLEEAIKHLHEQGISIASEEVDKCRALLIS